MKQNGRDIDTILDEALDAIRNEKVDDSVVSSAADRVWARLAAEGAATAKIQAQPATIIRGCEDFQSLIPAFFDGSLSQARKLLFEDHTRECIPCRKALKDARSGRVVAQPVTTRFATSTFATWKWRIAASLLIVFGIGAIFLYSRFGQFGTANATVASIKGEVFRVNDLQISPIKAGESITGKDRVRTGKDSHAVVQLEDGSLVEMKDRSEFYVTENSQGTTVHLDRGNVIVEAAKQNGTHLYVATNDAVVSVTGTIFSVNSGTKGSRVSVVEGTVSVNHATGNQVSLRAGEQTSTHASIERVPVRSEIEWSQSADRYVGLLAQIASLQDELNRVPRPGLRHSTRFLDMQPEGTVLYAALPNIATTLGESHRIMQERISQNAALKQWWDEEHKSAGGEAEMNRMMSRVRQFGEYLGDEIVASATMDASGHPSMPLILGELRNSAGFRAFVEEQVKTATANEKNPPGVRFVDDPSVATQSADARNELLVWVQGEFFAASPKLEALQKLAANAGGSNAFNGSSFHARIAELYREGAGLIVAADLEKIVPRVTSLASADKNDAKRAKTFNELGLSNLKHFVFEQKEVQSKTSSRAVLSFNDQRRGIASWLAAPAPMESLEFISPDANVVAAFVVKEPTALVDDLMGFMDTASPDLRKHLAEVEAKHGLNIRADFAAPLGGEFAFAIDGPVLPSPSWKMVFEVYDQNKLQQTIEKVVGELNNWAATQGRQGLRVDREESGGRTYFTLKSIDFGLEAHYTFANGYMIAAPTRALVERAITYRESGVTLLQSPKFRSGLPTDGNANFSAIFYHDLGSIVSPIASRVANSNAVPEGQREAFNSLASNMAPTLAYIYAENDRIILSANTDGGPFGLGTSTLLGMPNSFALHNILERGMRGGKDK